MKGSVVTSLFLLTFIWNAQAWNSPPEKPALLKFTENKNQWDTNVRYRADLPGGKLFLENNQLTYLFYDTRKLEELHDHHTGTSDDRARTDNKPEQRTLIGLHAFRVRFPGCSENITISAENKTHDYSNYFKGNDPGRWASGVRSYGRIQYRNIYDKTDLLLCEQDQTLKYEFRVYPGGDPDRIKIEYTGVKRIFLQDGALHILTSVNEIAEQAPFIYQDINGTRVVVQGKFLLKDSTLSFQTGAYNKKYPLIIDPKLIFSTYSGSSADNWGNTAAFDEAGNMYSGGTVFDTGFPTTLGAYQEDFAGAFPGGGFGIDVGILKFNPTGTGLVYATYLGGAWTDVPFSLVVNSSDELVIFGATSSDNFPTTAGAYDNTFNFSSSVEPVSGIVFTNGSDLFVSRLSPDGSALLASTLIGGNENDGILYQGESLTKNYGDQLRGDVITDDDDNVYVCSNTRSFNFPVTAGAVKTTLSGNKDACVFKFNKNLTSLLWSTYLGGSNEESAYSIQVDSLDNVYVAGGTNSNNFPVTTSVVQPARAGALDGFVSHISSDGTTLLHSTYLGTSSYDQIYFVQLDSIEDVYLLGQTRGNWPVSAGVYSIPNSGQFIHRLSHDLSATLMSTVIGTGGNNPNISLTAFLVNECGNIFLSGWGGNNNAADDGAFPTGYVGGSTTGLPTTADAYKRATDGSDFYIMVLEKNAASLLYATFFGGNGLNEHVDGGTSRFDKKGIIYQAVCGGCGGSDEFPTTPGAWSNTNNSGNCNNAAFKFDLASLRADFEVEKSPDCKDTKVSITNQSLGGKSFYWDLGDGNTSTSPGPITHTYVLPGTYLITLIATDLTTCTGKDTATESVFVSPPPVVSFNTTDTSMCKGDSIQLQVTGDSTYHYQWTPPGTLSSDTIPNPYSKAGSTVTYTVIATDTNNCTASKNVRVQVVEVDPDLHFENITDCQGVPRALLTNNTKGNPDFIWTLGDGTVINSTGQVVHEYKEYGTYTSILEIESNGCYFSDSITFTFEEIFFPNLITPNGDGQNDVYTIQGMGSNWTFEVYNRWGKAVFKSSDYKNEWKGEGLTDDIYYFVIISPNDRVCKGWVQVLH